jgi:hypothetical protein
MQMERVIYIDSIVGKISVRIDNRVIVYHLHRRGMTNYRSILRLGIEVRALERSPLANYIIFRVFFLICLYFFFGGV